MGHTERDMQRPTEYKKDWQKNMKGILLMLSHKILFKLKLLICSFSQTKGRQQHGFLQTPSCSCDVIFHMNVIMYEQVSIVPALQYCYTMFRSRWRAPDMDPPQHTACHTDHQTQWQAHQLSVHPRPARLQLPQRRDLPVWQHLWKPPTGKVPGEFWDALIQCTVPLLCSAGNRLTQSSQF